MCLSYAYDEGYSSRYPWLPSIPISLHIYTLYHGYEMVISRKSPTRVYLFSMYTPRADRGIGRPTRTSWSPTRKLRPLGGRLAASGPWETHWTTRGSTTAPNCEWGGSQAAPELSVRVVLVSKLFHVDKHLR